MRIDCPFGWRGGSGGGIMLFELIDGHITQKFVDVGRKVDGSRRLSGGGSASRRGIDRFPRGKGGDSRRPIEVGSMNLVEFLCWHVNATICGACGRVILGIEIVMMVRRQVMLVSSSRGGRGPRVVIAIISDAGILEQEVVVIPHGRSRSGGGEANEFFHSLNHPKFRDVVDSGLEDGQSSGIGQRFLRGRDFIQLSELFIEMEDKLLSRTPPRFIQDSCGDIGM